MVNPPYRLTRRERQILSCVVNGDSNAEIARQLGVRVQTIKNALSSIYGKLASIAAGGLRIASRNCEMNVVESTVRQY
jgi:DNA-binding CsgD family transcriptional regulator